MLKFSSQKAIREYLEESNPEALTIDGHSNALIGVAETFNGHVAVYDQDKILQNLVDGGIDNLEDADEFFRFNIIGAYVGPFTPIYLTGIKA
jgi:hypothetical protein